jgi:dipeptidyl aminopeptidase/acylaminoacyl peptidase
MRRNVWRLWLALVLVCVGTLHAQDTAPSTDVVLFISERGNSNGQREVWRINADGTDARNLTQHPADDRAAVWSPDGTAIAFISDRDSAVTVYVMDADGGAVRRISPQAARPWVAWQGARVVWVGVDGRAYQATADDALLVERVPLLRDFDALTLAVPSPNGLAWLLIRAEHEVWLVTSETVPTAPRFVSATPIREVRWSPNGRSAAFVANGELYMTDITAPAVRNLTLSRSTDESPAWSPDGAQLAYTANWDVVVMNAAGSAPANLSNSLTYERAPSWSPDGTHLAFAAFREGDDWELYVMRADGCGLRRLTDARGWDGAPQWRPNPSAQIVPAGARPPSVVVTTARANLRDGAGEQFNVVGGALFGECLTVLGQQGAWLNVQTEGGVSAWVAASVVGQR